MTIKPRARQNVGQVKLPKGLTARDMQKGRQLAADWHWFDPKEYDKQLKIVEWEDPDFPDGVLIECGNLARIHFRAPAVEGSGKHPRRRRDTMLTLSKPAAARSHLTFDPNHPGDRLYILIPEDVQVNLKTRFWDENPIPERSLEEWAMMAGGHHARGGYPDVVAKPVGIMTAVVYYTEKKDDGKSFYIHKMAEVSCTFPILVCDDRGRLWVCGGNYRSPTPGITD